MLLIDLPIIIEFLRSNVFGLLALLQKSGIEKWERGIRCKRRGNEFFERRKILI